MAGAARVVIAPDSFKGSIDAADAAAAIAAGWRTVRPDDELIRVPQADGGEGLLDVLAGALPDAVRIEVGEVTGPDGRPVAGRYLALGDGTAVVELAVSSGLPLMARPDPLGATTRGLGEVIARAVADGAAEVVVGLGGSASTDGGAGALAGLGARLLDVRGRDLPDGGHALLRLHSIEWDGLAARPSRGSRLLCDVVAPLLGPTGAAAVFGPQKGASASDVAALDAALERFADVLGATGIDRSTSGSGAAGGTAFGLASGWGSTIEAGSRSIARLTGLEERIRTADLVITGEGRFDETSVQGKVTGGVLDLAARAGVATWVVAGDVAAPTPSESVSLGDLAGGAAAAIAAPERWLAAAGEVMAGRWRDAQGGG